MPQPSIKLRPIGIIHTQYSDRAPYQPVSDNSQDREAFRVVVDPQFESGLKDLATFRYIYLLYYAHLMKDTCPMTVRPPWAGDLEIGLFASRSPARPNPLGLSVVRILKIAGRVIYTSGLDVFNGTPLLDIKPYIKDLDTKEDANYGWLDQLEDREHLALHIKGIPHRHQ